MAMELQRRPLSPVREEMRRHREATPGKRPVHPGKTQAEAGLTPAQVQLMTAGVCNSLANTTERADRIANWALGLGSVFIAVLIAGQVAGWW